MLSRVISGGVLTSVTGAAMLLLTSGPSAGFTLYSPSLEQPVAAAGVEPVWHRHWHHHWGWGHHWAWHRWGWPNYGYYRPYYYGYYHPYYYRGYYGYYGPRWHEFNDDEQD